VRGSIRTVLAAFALLVAALLIASAGGSDPRESPLPMAGERPLAVRDGRIVDADGREVMLRGFNVIPIWVDSPGRTWAAHHYREMRRSGFNTVRMVLHWDELEPERGRFDAERLATLDRAIAHARAAGLFVVLDTIHIYEGERFVPPWARTGDVVASVSADAHGYIRMLARRYRANPAVAGYDLVSEPPTDPLDQNRLLRMYSGLIASARSQGDGKLLMFNASGGDTSMVGADLTLLGDRRDLVFTMYDYYAGGAGDGYRDDGAADSSATGGAGTFTYDGKTGYSGTADELEQHLLVNLGVMREAGIPVWIGAFGIDPEAPGGERWIREKVALFKRHGVGYAWWLYGTGGGFATLDGSQRMKPFVKLLR
jgi:hypothetical protein